MQIESKGKVVYRCIAIIFFWAQLALQSTVLADQIVFVNGDRLTGRIDKLVDGKLTFESDLAGKVTIDIANIATFSSDEAVDLHLDDGSILSKQVAASEPNHVAIGPDQRIKFGRIVSINPPAKPKAKWTGEASAGFTSQSGNTNTEHISGSAKILRKTETDRATISADFARHRQEDPDTGRTATTEDWWRARAKYDCFFTKKLYGYYDARYETDAIAELDQRIILGTGLGYQWVESEDLNFSTEAGLAYKIEEYGNNTGKSDEITIQFGYNFDKKLGKGWELIHDLTYYPSTEDFSDYLLTTTGELRANLTETVFTNFKAILDYDATPAQGKHKTDTKYIWGIGWKF
ncbi:MAG: DUF481 domain-containing protein [Planctomycetota bacterium]|jgi:putative salt-induced outer membrane protein YdiY